MLGVLLGASLAGAAPARALDKVCDPAKENCRTVLINLIRAERIGIDVGFWFMEDARYTTELINRFNAGVPVRVLVDARANTTYPLNADRIAELRAAGIPMRQRVTGGILHYKLMLFAGQGTVQFSGANFSADAWVYTGASPYLNYVDEAPYFTDNPSFVNSFMTKFDDLWTNTSSYANYANITAAPARNYPAGYVKDPQLNFPPLESYATRAVGRYTGESQKIDVIMYRITDRRHTDAMIAAKARGVAVRVISEPEQYRDPKRLWDAWNVDRMHAAGISIKMRAHAGLNHQKLVLLYSQQMAIFGSSNWTTSSDNSQEEHNCFCTGASTFSALRAMFDRKWDNSAGVNENAPFVPLPPTKPVHQAPANAATGLSSSSVVLKWHGGLWAHKYDVLLGTDPNSLRPVLSDMELGPSQSATDYKSFTAGGLLPATTYYWRVVSRTMANVSKNGEIWSFTTGGTAVAPQASGTIATGDVVLHAGSGRITGSAWSIVADSSAAGGQRLWNRNAGAAKIVTPASSPASFVEFTFNGIAGQPYRLWMRGRGEGNVALNDSAFVQFSGSVTSTGTPTFRIGTTSATDYNLEDCSGCGLSEWGWQDNGWGLNVMGPRIYFATTGSQRLRIQTREDGLSIDQIILSPATAGFLTSSPGALKSDNRIYPATSGS